MRTKLKKATDTATADSASPTAPASSPTAIAVPVIPLVLTPGLAFTVPAKILLDAVRIAASACDHRSTMPILGEILIRSGANGVVIVGCDLNTWIVVEQGSWVPTGQGEVTANAKALLATLAALPKGGDVTITGVDRGVRGIRVDHSPSGITAAIAGSQAQDFPKFPAVLGSDSVQCLTTVDADLLKVLLKSTLHAASKDAARLHLNGVCIEYDGVRAVAIATDGHRLAKCERELPRMGDFDTAGFPDRRMILPSAGVKEIVKRIKGSSAVSIGLVNGLFCVRQDAWTICVKPTDMVFPAWQQVVPTTHKSLVTVDRLALIGALTRAALRCSPVRGVKLTVADGLITLTASDPDLGDSTESLPVEANDRELHIGVQPNYMIDALKVIADARVTLALKSELDPILLRGLTDAVSVAVMPSTFLAVVMPMRI